jgi:tRNA pseudouridine32 synthase/23S rRNA pseudouridine746 synthase
MSDALQPTAEVPLTIVFDHDDFVVISKPANVNFHNEEGSEGFVSMVNRSYRSHLERHADPAKTAQQLYPVHRLDRVTSGLMLFAKSAETNATLSGLFQEKRVVKAYLAISASRPKKKQGLVVGDMEKARNGSYRLLRSKENPAKTRFTSFSLNDSTHAALRLFLLRPETGKTHQLRVMMKSLGSPILGDQRYKGEASDRCYLHAYRLCFEIDGKTYDIHDLPASGELFTKHLASKAVQGWLHTT